MNRNFNNSEPKFTRGEKCIFTHLVISFSFILFIVIIYLVHLYLVNHTLQDVFITRRSFIHGTDTVILDSIPIGKMYLNGTATVFACNTLLLSPKWSVGPGHCIAIRSEPELSNLLSSWRIKYRYDNTGVKIINSIVHPHLDRDTFANNIALVRHATIRGKHKYNLHGLDTNENTYNYDKNTLIVSWNQEGENKKDTNLEMYDGTILNKRECAMHMAPIIELRSYEFCVTVNNKPQDVLEHGALVVDRKDKHILGFFTWGEKREATLPLVFLTFTDFKNWLNVIVI